MLDLYEKIETAVAAIRRQWDKQAYAGVILGTGLGSLVDQIEIEVAIDYEEIPHFVH